MIGTGKHEIPHTRTKELIPDGTCLVASQLCDTRSHSFLTFCPEVPFIHIDRNFAPCQHDLPDSTLLFCELKIFNRVKALNMKKERGSHG